MGNYDFADWLKAEMLQRALSKADLARAAGLYPSTINMILTRERNAGPDVCKALSRALGLPPELVFRRAGLLPETTDTALDPVTQEICAVAQQLELADRQDVLNYVKFRLRQSRTGIN